MSYVYFFRPKGEDGPVKIGHSTYPASRLVTYLAWSPVPLEICAQLKFEGADSKPLARTVEHQFHARYSRYRLHHEWFTAHPLLLRDIEAIRHGRFHLSVLPSVVCRTRRTSPAYSEARRAPTQRFAA